MHPIRLFLSNRSDKNLTGLIGSRNESAQNCFDFFALHIFHFSLSSHWVYLMMVFHRKWIYRSNSELIN